MFFFALKELAKGKSIHKILINFCIQGYKLHGRVIDFGGGKKMIWSHFRYLKKEEGMELQTVDIDKNNNPDFIVNLENEKLSVLDSSFIMALAFNVLEHIYNVKNLLSESYRVLSPGGEFLGSVPFLLRVHPDPNDYFRYTKDALEKLMKEAGFSEVKIKTAGLGPFTAGYLQIEPFMPKILRMIIFSFSFLADKLILRLKPQIKEYYPLGYVWIAKKL